MMGLAAVRRRLRPSRGRDAFGAVDVLAEATSDIGTRRGRLVATLAGSILGIGALVATIGLSQTSAVQIARQFDAASTSQAVIRPVQVQGADGSTADVAPLPWDAADRVQAVAGVEDAAAMAPLDSAAIPITAVEIDDPTAYEVSPPLVIASTESLIDAVEGHIVTGRMFDAGHVDRGDRVVVVGSRAADQLGVRRLDGGVSIYLDGSAYSVLGIFDDVVHRAELLDAVVLPMGTARTFFGLAAPAEVQVRLAPGAGTVFGAQAPVVVSPDAPETVEALASTGDSTLQDSVQDDMSLVFVIVSLVVLIAGGVGIANVTMLSVLERTGEIGLRRALGATRRQIAAQFVTESVLLGLLGGLLGASVGVSAVIGVALVQGWAPIVDPLIALSGVGLGGLVGLAAGGLPGRRAARIEPVDALRSG